MTLTAISPRFATRTLVNMGARDPIPSSHRPGPPRPVDLQRPAAVCKGRPTHRSPTSAAPRPRRCAPFCRAFEQVVTSDLRRASETAALLGYPDARARRALAGDRPRRLGRAAVAEFPDEQQGAWRGGPLHAPRRRVLARSSSPGWAERSTSWPRAGGDWLVVCHGGAIRAALSHVTGRGPPNRDRPGQHERHGAAPAVRRALRLDPRVVSDVTSLDISRKFSREGAFQRSQPLSSWGL